MPRKKRTPPTPTKANLRYDGWRIYKDSGVIHRYWTFLEAHVATAAPKGATLEDCGPVERPYPRFRIRGLEPDYTVLLRYATQQEVESAVGLSLAPWHRAPRDIDIHQLKSLHTITGQLAALSDAKSRLDKIRQLLDKNSAPPTAPTPPAHAQQNQHLRLISEDTYQGGEVYRDWELLRDAAEITALKGDMLREEDRGDATPFRLYRAGRQIAAPEWWQVCHLFVGLAAWHTEVSPPAGKETMSDDGHGFSPSAVLVHPDEDYAFLATTDIAGTRIQKGDVLSKSEHVALSTPARMIPLNVAEYEALRALYDSGTDLTKLFPLIGREPTWCRGHHQWVGVTAFARDKKQWGLRAKVWKPKLFAFRRIAPSTPKPVDALSDEGAIFELLSGAGCRMPESKS